MRYRRPVIRRTPGLLLLLSAVLLLIPSAAADDWPFWHGPTRDSVWHESGILKKFPEGGPEVKWRIPINPGYTGPTVVGEHVFVMDRLAEEKDPDDEERGLPGRERVLCVSAATGDTVWERDYDCRYVISYPEGPRASPVFDNDKVYTLGAMGHLKCFNASDGEIVWETNLAERYESSPPLWGFAATPLIDENRIYCVVGGEGSGLVCLDKNSGDELWKAITAEEVGYSPPVIYEKNGERQLVFWHDVAINSLVPETGELNWTFRTPDFDAIQRPVVTIVTPRFLDDLVYISEFYNGSTVVRIKSNPPDVELVWRDKPNGQPYRDNLNILMTSPVMKDGLIYGVSGDGEMRCLRLDNGELVWRDRTPIDERRAHFGTVFFVENEGRYFIFNDQGFLLIAELDSEGYHELDRVKLLEPTGFSRGRNFVWSHPAFAHKCMYARNDEELICVDLSDSE